MATLFSERSVIAARSSSLSGGAIAGAVVGSVVGALLIVLCAFPFIVRARKRRGQHGDSAQAELGQSLGGPIHPDMEDAVKRLSTDHSVPVPDYGFPHNPVNGAPVGDGLDDAQKAASVEHQKPHQPPLDSSNVAIQQGPPSPISPPISPTTRSTPSNALSSTPADPIPSSTDSTSRSKSRLGSVGTVGRDSTRELSLTDSNRDITSSGITEEPESLERSSSHRRFSNIPESIRGFIRRQSGHHRRDSRRSTLEGTRSPSLISDITSQAQPPAPVFNIDTEARGEAWSYYHPYLSDEPQDTYLPTSSAPAPAPATTGLTIVPPSQPFVTTPLSPVSPVQHSSASADVAPFMTNRPIVEDPDAISPDSDKTVTPSQSKSFSRQSSLFGKKFPGGPLQRTDSLPPPTIVSDIPSPPLQLSIGPSGNPMEFMKPTTDSENAWMLRQEIIKMEASPPPDTFYTPPLPTVDETPVVKTDPSPEPEPQPHPQQGYNSPPEIEITAEDINDFDIDHFIESNDIDVSDWSTPPASSDLSASNTPDTRLTEPYTASPSPRSDFGPNAGQLGTSPRAFACDQCHRVFDQIHKLNHHKRYHDRPHECPHAGCTMKFGTKTHLDRHINDKHNKTRKFYCTQPDCPYSRQGGKSFPRKDNWRRHIMNKHRITPDSDPGPMYVDELMGGT